MIPLNTRVIWRHRLGPFVGIVIGNAEGCKDHVIDLGEGVTAYVHESQLEILTSSAARSTVDLLASTMRVAAKRWRDCEGAVEESHGSALVDACITVARVGEHLDIRSKT